MTLWIETIGFTAAALTTVSFVPQVVRTLRTRDTRGISLWMYALFSTGVALWGIYGLLIGSWPVIAANAITLVLASIVLWHKLRETPETPSGPDAVSKHLAHPFDRHVLRVALDAESERFHQGQHPTVGAEHLAVHDTKAARASVLHERTHESCADP